MSTFASHHESTHLERFSEAVKCYGDRPFLQWMDNEPQTYADTDVAIRRLAAGIRDLGCKAGDRVLVMLPNSLELVHAWFAIAGIGGVEVPINIHLKGGFLKHVIVDADAEILLIHESFISAFEASGAAVKHVVVLSTSEDTRVGDLAFHNLYLPEPIASYHVPARKDVSGIFYTSGTTGPSKGVLVPYGQFEQTALAHAAAVGMTAEDILYCCMPLFHINAQMLQIAAPMYCGASISIWPEFKATEWLDEVRTAGATVTHMLGVMAEAVHARPAYPSDTETALRVVHSIPMPARIAADFEARFGVRVIEAYGSTDLGLVTMRAAGSDLVPGSAGSIVDGFDVRIMDPQTDELLGPNQMGEIVARPRRAYTMMIGYWRRSDATADAFRNLWFHSGDLGHIDDNGNLFFRDRAKDAIRVKGENLSANQIEDAVALHPCVERCAAIGLPAATGDHEVMIFVVLERNAVLTEDVLFEHCRLHMPYFALPRYIQFITELPMTATQKVQREELRKVGVTSRAWDRIAAGIRLARPEALV